MSFSNSKYTTQSSISIVVPVYNSELFLSELLKRLVATLDECSSDYQIIFVNDGSRDLSWKIIQNLAESNPCIIGIDLGKNYGQHNALLAGIRAAQNEIIITLDDDLQNPPEEIPKLLAALVPELDVVYGAKKQEQHGLLRNLASRLVKLSLAYFVGVKTADKSSSFRAFRTVLRDGFKDYQCDFISIDVLLSWTTQRFGFVTVDHFSRSAGKSNYSPWKLYRHAINMITGFTTIPLQVATGVGLIFTLFGGFILSYVFFNYFWLGNRVPGFAFLACLISIFSGATLFSVGILGEYLARVFSRALEKPTYVIRRQTQLKKETERGAVFG